MKKLVSLICVFALLALICACTKDGGTAAEPQSTVEHTDTANSDYTGTNQQVTDIQSKPEAENEVTTDNVQDTTVNTPEQSDKEKNSNQTTTAASKNQQSINKPQNDKNTDNRNQDKNNSTTSKKQEQTNTTTACKHQNTITKNAKKQTCTESGYSGDIYCTDCGKCIEKGEMIEADGHLSVEVYNIIQPTKNAPGYSGDKRCRICGAELEKGEVIPKLSPDPEPVTHNNAALEYEILDLLNTERAKEGYSPLYFNENAYRCAKIRTSEIIVKFSHERPLGGYFDSILTNDGVSYSTAGENIQRGTSDNTVQQMVDAFMNSEAHRANIMNNKYTSAAICVEYAGGAYYVTQIFIG